VTDEALRLIALDGQAAAQALDLHRRSAAALVRAQKAQPGDRTDVVRHEAAQSQLEAIAVAAQSDGAQYIWAPPLTATTWSALVESDEAIDESVRGQVQALRQRGHVIVAVVHPFIPGATPMPTGLGAPLPVPRRFTEGEGLRGVEAVRARFRQQVAAAAASIEGETPEPVVPSGVSNSVLTECLREFAATSADRRALLAPIGYRDGSKARAFPLGALTMPADPSPATLDETWWRIGDRALRFTLLSIRHVELDTLVDGAWLRNTAVSRPRPQGDTDELVYEASRAQLSQITSQGPVSLMMFQTGLEPAVVGFYRAVVDHLRERPSSLSVLPCYYRKAGSYLPGTPWRSA
jgi:hypothetical protein